MKRHKYNPTLDLDTGAPPTPSTPATQSDKGETEEISGIVDHIVFRNEDNGYTVCVVKTQKQARDFIVVGTCAAIWAGESLKAEGHWVRHREHGHQFVATRIVCVEPHSAAGIEKYLASGFIKGIGEVLAKRLVAKFGDDTLNVIEKESAKLQSVDGIGKMRREQIKTAWNEQKAVRDIMLYLHSHGVSTSQAMRIYRQYRDDSIALIKENPYRLAAEIWGIGFKSADKIAMNLGIEPQSVIRARAGLVYSLQTLTDEGHCYCPKAELIQVAEQLLTIPSAILEQALELELTCNSLTREEDAIYLTSLYHAEVGVANRLHYLHYAPNRFPSIIADKAVAWAGQRMRLTFAPSQARALELALTEKSMIITGGPGVGKTTIIRALVDIFMAKHLNVCLAAPTGRAAKRLEEATHRKAMTLHRLLKYLPNASRFEHNADNPLEGDVFILDEVSMIDVVLMNVFLHALPAHAHLILVGDADQLPSVGPGNVLRDCIESGVIPTVKLDTIFRQGDRSWIVHNAHRVNTGLGLELPTGDSLSDFYFIEIDTPDTAVQKAVELITQRIPQRFGLNPKTDIQLLTPMRRFQLGAENMNAVLQEALNPKGPAVLRFGRAYRVGDRVMQLRNNYDKDVYNGDIGWIRSIDAESQEIEVDYDGRGVAYELAELDELTLAYACSIHKSQGNEHPAVVILMTTQHYKLLQRNLLYTAITRGRKLVCLIGTKKALTIAIRNNQTVQRKTGLKQRLVHLFSSSP